MLRVHKSNEIVLVGRKLRKSFLEEKAIYVV